MNFILDPSTEFQHDDPCLGYFFEEKIIFGLKRVQKMCKSVWETWSYIISNHIAWFFKEFNNGTKL